MALFDSVNPALAQNGQGGPPSMQQNMTPPGIFSGFGNVPGLSGGQPVGLAAGLQRFMGAPQFMAMLQRRGLQPGSASPFQAAGPIGADVQGQRPELLRGAGMPPPQGFGGGVAPGMAPGLGPVGMATPATAMPSQMAAAPGGLAGGMSPFLRR